MKKANCLHCRTKFQQKIFNYRYCEETPECKEAGNEAKNALIKKAMEKAKLKTKIKAKAEIAVLKEKVKTLSQYEAEAKKSFQKYIRLRDESQNCISCNESNKDLWDGGHFKKAEIYSGVIFNENNCHKQCRKCNRYLNGNELMYRQGLVNRYGEDYVKNIEELANETRQYKWTKEQLIAKKLQYEIKIKEFKPS